MQHIVFFNFILKLQYLIVIYMPDKMKVDKFIKYEIAITSKIEGVNATFELICSTFVNQQYAINDKLPKETNSRIQQQRYSQTDIAKTLQDIRVNSQQRSSVFEIAVQKKYQKYIDEKLPEEY